MQSTLQNGREMMDLLAVDEALDKAPDQLSAASSADGPRLSDDQGKGVIEDAIMEARVPSSVEVISLVSEGEG